MPERLTPYEIMEKLVSFPTVSRETNLPLIDWVQDYLESHGVQVYRHLHPSEPKAGLWAHAGPMEEGAVILSGHTDVVPVDGQDWSTDPFTVREADGKYYGRGCCDMKGFDALAIWAMAEAQATGTRRPLQLALTYDEEVGLIGADPLLKDAAGRFPRAAAAIVGEPTTMQAVTGHKGGMAWDVHVHGYEIHSSIAYRGVSAIMEGARLIQWANEVNAASAAATPSDVNAAFDPPWSNLHVGMIHGGTAHNITAKDCEFVFSIRLVPGDDPEAWKARIMGRIAEIEAEMQAIRPETSIEVTERFAGPGLNAEPGGPAETLVRQLTGDNARHVVSYGTEAGYFQQHGFDAVVCGPGDIQQAHQPDEYITIEQFETGHGFMRRLLDHLNRD
ncbi:acetylornithine deacetylase [Pseudooceanicola batsensis HTCC2597]|uniref:Acetylornithine deacetylase n=1 Tax=Pseudooceanicola batsensis (strain ATCC BAA-863 / DSM 15984 / KCTC 12145 / HTCC2597) TaxID=252305 RepID=A3U468_PSEBH|nr:acetylornithine deacetylase [Pseudooceanicola batsensis]EAQ01055.1 acetylornithine deacetylase [Pseudooceanicola batsensis HTCC2597]